MTFAATHLPRDSHFFFQGRWRVRKRGTRRMSWSWRSLTSQERIFTRQFVEKLRSECKVIHHAHQDAAQCFDSYCERTIEKLDYNIGAFNPCLYKHPVEDVSVLRHGDDFATLATRTQIAEFKEDLSKHLLVKHNATLGPRPQLLDACEVRFLNRVIRWLYQGVERRQNVLKSKLTQDRQNF